jgi:cell division protein FtsW
LVGLIFLEPDRSMSVFVALSGFVLWILSGARKRHSIPATVFGVVLFYFLVKDSGTAQRRWLAYLQQDDCQSDAGFQVCQSKIGLANGGVVGQGPGRGRQKLGYLPEPHTDFIFSVVGEELGFLGCAATLFGFATYVWLGFSVARRATDLQATLLAAGITFVVGVQALINISVATGVVPPTGIALPFISYGGSSLVSSMGATGILVNIARSIR